MAELRTEDQRSDSGRDAESLIDLQRRVTHEHITSETEKRWRDTYSTFSQTEHAALDAMGIGARFAGIDAVKSFYEVFHAAFPDFTVTTLREYDMPGTSIREVMIRGTHRGEYCGQAATGRRVAIPLIGLFLFGSGENAGQLMVERVYWDNSTVLSQLRGESDPADVLDVSKLRDR